MNGATPGLTFSKSDTSDNGLFVSKLAFGCSVVAKDGDYSLGDSTVLSSFSKKTTVHIGN